MVWWRGRPPTGWEGRPCCIGRNKEVYDAEVYALYRALEFVGRREATGRRYTIFSDLASAVDRIRSNRPGPG